MKMKRLNVNSVLLLVGVHSFLNEKKIYLERLCIILCCYIIRDVACPTLPGCVVRRMTWVLLRRQSVEERHSEVLFILKAFYLGYVSLLTSIRWPPVAIMAATLWHGVPCGIGEGNEEARERRGGKSLRLPEKNKEMKRREMWLTAKTLSMFGGHL